jgi:hypothetical protein
MKLTSGAASALQYCLQIALLFALAYGIMVVTITAYGWGMVVLSRYGFWYLALYNGGVIGLVAFCRALMLIPIFPAVIYWKFFRCRKCGFINAIQTSLINPAMVKCENCGEE